MGTEGFLIQFTMALSKGHREVSPPGLPLLNSMSVYMQEMCMKLRDVVALF